MKSILARWLKGLTTVHILLLCMRSILPMPKLPPNNITRLPGRFPETVVREAHNLEFTDEVFENRREIRGFTLDAIDSPDLDDAIWMERTAEGYLVQVTISDVDTLVTLDSYVEAEAISRVISHYFPAKEENGKIRPKYVIPMLPKVLSENRLSLLEGKLRPTLTVEMELNQDLRLISVNVGSTYMKSAKRLGLREYGDQKIIADPGLPLRHYYQLAKKLNGQRWADEESFSLLELHEGIFTDEDGKAREGSISAASLIVQEFMVLANFAVAKLLQEQKLAAPFRNHQPVCHNTPKEQRYPTKQQIIQEIERNPDYLTLVDNIRATYSKALGSAIYAPQSAGHYGLGLSTYLHFTSPVRRYADLTVHRVLKALINGDRSPFEPEEMVELCHYLNQTIRRLATLRANHDQRNSLNNYRNFGHMLSREKNRRPDYVERLLDYLKINRIGNACFEFTASAGMNIEVTCRASVRYQRIRQIVSFTARADKNAVKNEAARLLLKKLRTLESESPAILKKKNGAGNGRELENATRENSPVQELYRLCEEANYPIPTIHYEIWNGSRRPGEDYLNFRCHCRISDTMMVIGTGESRLAAKIDGATRLLNYLKSNPHISRQSVLPPLMEEESDETD